jgi:hypothetical protein
MNFNLSQHKLNRDTVILMSQISSAKTDSEIIKIIKNTSKKVINHDIQKYHTINHPNLNYLDPFMNIYSSVLAQVMYRKSEEVIHAVLDLTDKIDDFLAFYKLLTHQIYHPRPLDKMMAITNRCIDLGLDLNATNPVKFFNHDSSIPQPYYYQANYLKEAVKGCVKKEPILRFIHNTNQTIETGEIKYVINPESVEFLKFLVSKGLKKQEHDGELIDVAITQANKELIHVVCSLEGVDIEYIDKGINSWHKINSKPNVGVDYKNTFEYQQSVKIIDYIKPCFESIKMSHSLVTSKNLIKIRQKI